jgi:hypothetical protein
MPEALQFLHDRICPAGPNEQDSVRQSSDQVGLKLFVGQQLLSENRVLRLNQADASMELGRDPSARIGSILVAEH